MGMTLGDESLLCYTFLLICPWEKHRTPPLDVISCKEKHPRKGIFPSYISHKVIFREPVCSSVCIEVTLVAETEECLVASGRVSCAGRPGWVVQISEVQPAVRLLLSNCSFLQAFYTLESNCLFLEFHYISKEFQLWDMKWEVDTRKESKSATQWRYWYLKSFEHCNSVGPYSSSFRGSHQSR